MKSKSLGAAHDPLSDVIAASEARKFKLWLSDLLPECKIDVKLLGVYSEMSAEQIKAALIDVYRDNARGYGHVRQLETAVIAVWIDRGGCGLVPTVPLVDELIAEREKAEDAAEAGEIDEAEEQAEYEREQLDQLAAEQKRREKVQNDVTRRARR